MNGSNTRYSSSSLLKTHKRDVRRPVGNRQGKLVPRSSSWCVPRLILAGLWIARATGRPAACFAGSRGNGAFSRQPSSIACTSPNPTSIRLWYWAGGIHIPILSVMAINDAPSKETSTDTFVQLVSRHFSGLIAIVRSQEVRLFGFRNRSDERTTTEPAL